MKISTKYRYGTRAMLELALNFNKQPLSVRRIALKHDISKKYLERLMQSLSSAGLVISQRGKKGGFVLSKSPDKITLSEIVQAVEGPLILMGCVEDPETCKRISTCVTHDVWGMMQDLINGKLDSITLADLVTMQRKKISKINDSIYHI
ncbi:Rrf2 family transcriptional regulator [bacterium]|nr:Rrf2 family transcriptional regulator [bacterium]